MLIGITGSAGAGKDTAGAILSEYLQYPTYAFAWPLKRYCMVKFGLSWTDVNTEEGKSQYLDRLGCTVRELLQKEGTEHTKPFWGEDFWIKRLESDMVGPFGIVTDVRFRAEAEWIKSKGGMVISIQREGVGPANDHSSEKTLPQELVNHVVHNNGTIGELKAKLEGLFLDPRE